MPLGRGRQAYTLPKSMFMIRIISDIIEICSPGSHDTGFSIFENNTTHVQCDICTTQYHLKVQTVQRKNIQQHTHTTKHCIALKDWQVRQNIDTAAPAAPNTAPALLERLELLEKFGRAVNQDITEDVNMIDVPSDPYDGVQELSDGSLRDMWGNQVLFSAGQTTSEPGRDDLLQKMKDLDHYSHKFLANSISMQKRLNGITKNTIMTQQ